MSQNVPLFLAQFSKTAVSSTLRRTSKEPQGKRSLDDYGPTPNLVNSQLGASATGLDAQTCFRWPSPALARNARVQDLRADGAKDKRTRGWARAIGCWFLPRLSIKPLVWRVYAHGRRILVEQSAALIGAVAENLCPAIGMATLTIAKQNRLFECLQEFDLLRKSALHMGGLSFEKTAQPAVFAFS